jgi:hypothetical protein
MNPALDPWRQELGSDVMTSSEVLPDGRERRCYHLRQIGREVRLRQRDNIYLVLERPDGRGRVARACWQENVIELER